MPTSGSSVVDYEMSGNNALIDALEHLSKGVIGTLREFAAIIISADGTMKYGGYDRLVSAVDSFLDSEWFTRVWTIQELMLTNNALMLCGRSAVQWHTVQQAPLVLESYVRDQGGALTTGEQEDDVTPSALSQKPLILALRRLLERLSRFVYIKQGCVRIQSLDNDHLLHRRENALRLLQECRSQKASDPRDKLFAFYSIAKVAFGNVWPDYTLETVDIFQASTFANIKDTDCFDTWALKEAEVEEHPGPALQDLPSWVIDWSRPGSESLQPGIRYRFKLDYLQSSTTQQCLNPLARPSSRGMLLVVGHEVSEVMEVTNTFYTSFSLMGRSRWDSTSWEQHAHILREWSSFLSSMFGLQPAQSSAMLNRLWRIMVGKEVYRGDRGSIMLGDAKEEEEVLAILQSDELFKNWWMNHLGTWPGYEPGRDFVEPPDLAPLTHRCRIRAEDRRLCRLSGNYLGLVPRQRQPNDRIYLIRGSNWPIVLCPDATASPEHPQLQTFTLVGTCLVGAPDLDQKSGTHPTGSEILIS